MKDVFIINLNGDALMPTTRVKARKLLKAKKAEVFSYFPFTIKLLYDAGCDTQKIELCVDTGSQHIGISVKCSKHEYVHSQFNLLKGEKENHEKRLSNRRTRRGRLRYRAARFGNRVSSKKEGWLAPTVKNKKDRHVDLISKFINVCPISTVVVETGQFDTSQMRAIEKGQKLEGVDYQQGLKFMKSSIREAVLQRDNYTCQCCGKGIKDNIVLKIHHNIHRHLGGSDSVDNLVTVCSGCHTSKNHKPGGKLESGAFNKIKPLKDASHMNIIRWYIVNEIKEKYPNINIKNTYGAYTKVSRRELGKIVKTHANDAYVMGELHPKHRHIECVFEKQRRTTRAFESFHDALYIDSRDGKIKTGSELSCERTNRSEKRNSDKNERIFRKTKKKKGFRQINKTKPYKDFKKGDLIQVVDDIKDTGAKNRRAYNNGDVFICGGTACYGRYLYDDGYLVPIKKCKLLRKSCFVPSWRKI